MNTILSKVKSRLKNAERDVVYAQSQIDFFLRREEEYKLYLQKNTKSINGWSVRKKDAEKKVEKLKNYLKIKENEIEFENILHSMSEFELESLLGDCENSTRSDHDKPLYVCLFMHRNQIKAKVCIISAIFLLKKVIKHKKTINDILDDFINSFYFGNPNISVSKEVRAEKVLSSINTNLQFGNKKYVSFKVKDLLWFKYTNVNNILYNYFNKNPIYFTKFRIFKSSPDWLYFYGEKHHISVVNKNHYNAKYNIKTGSFMINHY
jgi:hypothetical protein